MASFPGILFDNWPEPEPPLEEAGQSVDFIIFFVHHCVLKASKVLVRNLLAQEKTYLRVQIPLRQRSKEENLWLVGSWRPWSHRRDPEAGWVKLVKDFESRPARLDPWVGTQSLCLGCFA